MPDIISSNISPASHDLTDIAWLCEARLGVSSTRITPLAGAGSNRRYYKIESGNYRPIVATVGNDKAENEAFINLSRLFAGERGLPVPEILAVSDDSMLYLQTWAGEKSLFDALAKARDSGHYTDEDIALLEEAMQLLARLQVVGGKDLDYSICHPGKEMDSRMVRWDLNYFKYCFLKPSGIEFDENPLQDDFDRLENILLADREIWSTFMVRDYQSRNVMVDGDGKLTAIDFQGGRRGPAAYDVASFLWQAKARYPEDLKNRLIDTYIKEASSLSPRFDGEKFSKELPYFILFRCLQTLGAYGFRGWAERKPHFLQSVPAGVDNLATLFTTLPLASEFPVLSETAVKLHARYGHAQLPAEDIKGLHRHIVASKNPLTVRVTSFSFKKGVPEDPSGNGGGFVFDCRAPHNPGRYEPYKKLTGLNAPVREFLERDGEIKPFIDCCEKLVDASVERYIQRSFTSLSVNFGCTGGQHRSVYCADAVARHLNDKYGVKVLVNHREQGISSTLAAKTVDVVFDSFLRDPQKSYSPDKDKETQK